jgi:hypothetical protein
MEALKSPTNRLSYPRVPIQLPLLYTPYFMSESGNITNLVLSLESAVGTRTSKTHDLSGGRAGAIMFAYIAYIVACASSIQI